MLPQVEGCDADLSLENKAYCQKKRICSQHMRAECIIRPGDNQDLWRFCFQVSPNLDEALQSSQASHTDPPDLAPATACNAEDANKVVWWQIGSLCWL